MNARKLAVCYAASVPHDISIPRLTQMIKAGGCKTIEDVKRMLAGKSTFTLGQDGRSAGAAEKNIPI